MVACIGMGFSPSCKKFNHQSFFIFPSMKSNKLNLFSLTMIVIGLVIGMGIFRTSSDAANAALTPNVFFLAWVAGGLIALCGALTYAEIGSRYPVTGGYYKIFAECLSSFHCFCYQLYHSYFKCRFSFRCSLDRKRIYLTGNLCLRNQTSICKST